MKIKSFKKKNQNEYKVLLSDGTSLSFYDDTIINYNLLLKKEISNEELKSIVEYNAKFEAYYKALKWITIKLRTEKEISDKLSKDYSKETISFVIEKLKKQGYINNDLYIKSFILDQINLTMNGPYKITKELKKLGFSENYLTNYSNMLDCDDEWCEKIDKLIQKKVKSNHNLSSKMLEVKIRKDLINLGYDKNLIDKKLDNYEFVVNDDVALKEYNKIYKKLSRKYSGEELKFIIRQKMYQKGFTSSEFDKLLDK